MKMNFIGPCSNSIKRESINESSRPGGNKEQVTTTAAWVRPGNRARDDLHGPRRDGYATFQNDTQAIADLFVRTPIYRDGFVMTDQKFHAHGTGRQIAGAFGENGRRFLMPIFSSGRPLAENLKISGHFAHVKKNYIFQCKAP